MVDTFSLVAESRQVSKKSARETRAQKRVPGVVYGSGTDPVAISVDQSDILRTYRKAGTSSLIELKLDGKKIKVLVHDLQLHPVHNTIRHIDFYAVNLKEKTDIQVPFEFVGESLAIKNLGGLLMKENDTITIRCFPTDIPHSLEVDIARMENIGDHVTVEDLKLDTEKFEVMDLNPDSVICSVVAPQKEEDIPTEAPEAEEVASEKGSDGGADEEEEKKE